MLIKKTTILVSVIAAACCSHFGAYAQNSEGFTANATLLTGYDDNILRSVDKSSDSYVSLSPVLSLNSLYGKHNFTALYKGDYTRYSENSNFNSAQHDVSIRALFDHSLSFNTEFKLFYQQEVEEPGFNNSALDASADAFNEYNVKSIETKFTYGSRESIGQLRLSLNINDREFTNNFQEFRNVDKKNVTATFFYKIGGKTRLLFQGTFETFDYVSAPINSDQSSDSVRYLVGVDWIASKATTGSIMLGYQEKNYDAEQFNSFSGLSYIVDLAWQPNSYTEVTVSASKQPQESAQFDVGGFFSNSYKFGIKHELTHNFQLVSAYEKTNDEVPSITNRTDKRQELQIGVNYRVNQWLETALHFRHQKRKSEVVSFNFDANIIELSFTSKFD